MVLRGTAAAAAGPAVQLIRAAARAQRRPAAILDSWGNMAAVGENAESTESLGELSPHSVSAVTSTMGTCRSPRSSRPPFDKPGTGLQPCSIASGHGMWGGGREATGGGGGGRGTTSWTRPARSSIEGWGRSTSRMPAIQLRAPQLAVVCAWLQSRGSAAGYVVSTGCTTLNHECSPSQMSTTTMQAKGALEKRGGGLNLQLANCLDYTGGSIACCGSQTHVFAERCTTPQPIGHRLT